MFENKVLVNLYILSLGINYEMYVPVNERVGNISKLLNTAMFDGVDNGSNYTLINIEDGTYYKENDIIRDTNIKNGTRLLLV